MRRNAYRLVNETKFLLFCACVVEQANAKKARNSYMSH
jgi:hypothetical protein